MGHKVLVVAVEIVLGHMAEEAKELVYAGLFGILLCSKDQFINNCAVVQVRMAERKRNGDKIILVFANEPFELFREIL